MQCPTSFCHHLQWLPQFSMRWPPRMFSVPTARMVNGEPSLAPPSGPGNWWCQQAEMENVLEASLLLWSFMIPVSQLWEWQMEGTDPVSSINFDGVSFFRPSQGTVASLSTMDFWISVRCLSQLDGFSNWTDKTGGSLCSMPLHLSSPLARSECSSPSKSRTAFSS